MNKKLIAFGGGAVLVVLVAVLGLAVWRVQNQKPTVTMPKAAGASCTGNGQIEVGHCGGHGACTEDCSCGCGTSIDPGQTYPPCKTSFSNYVCTYTSGDNWCRTAKKVDCGTKTDQSSCQAVSGCSWTVATPPTKSCTISLDKTSVKTTNSVAATVNGSVTNGSDSVYFWLSKQITATGQNATVPITPRPTTTPALLAGPANDNWDPTHSLGGGDIFQYYTKVCDANNTSCSGTVTINPLPVGAYNVFCQVGLYGNVGANDCSGQPLCPNNGGTLNCTSSWKDCGPNDRTTLTVSGGVTTCTRDADCSGGNVCAFP